MAVLSLKAPVAAANHLHAHLRSGATDNGRLIGKELIDALGQQGAFMAVISALKHVSTSKDKDIDKPFSLVISEKELCRRAEVYFSPAFIKACKLDVITFYTDKAYWADNFSAFAIDIDGVRYPTVEHAYQAAKFDSPALKDLIVGSMSPYQAKEFGHDPEFVSRKRPTWEGEKVAVMLNLLQKKVEQHILVKRKLLATGVSILVEDSPEDNFWGRGPDWNGLNMLGRLWMVIRESVRLGTDVDVGHLNDLARTWKVRQAKI